MEDGKKEMEKGSGGRCIARNARNLMSIRDEMEDALRLNKTIIALMNKLGQIWSVSGRIRGQ